MLRPNFLARTLVNEICFGVDVQFRQGRDRYPCEFTATESEAFSGPRVLSEDPACIPLILKFHSMRCRRTTFPKLHEVASKTLEQAEDCHSRASGLGLWSLQSRLKAVSWSILTVAVASPPVFANEGGSLEPELGQPSSRLPAGVGPRPR